MKIFVEPGATIPSRAHPTDVGLDLHCVKGGWIWPFGNRTFDTGVHFALPPGTWGKIESKSGLNVKHNIVSCGGTIDESYRGSVKVKLYNLGLLPYWFFAGDKIAQMVILACDKPDIECCGSVEELDETDRQFGGFGSTGR